MRLDVDPVAAQNHESLVAGLRALKAACGKSTTQIASDADLSTSGIEGMLAGASFPLEETIRRFVEACGADARPWLQARARAAGNRPKASRVAPEVREELEALRKRNTELAEQVATLQQQVGILQARPQTTELMEQNGATVDWTARAERSTAEFFDALQLLYIHTGEPPLGSVAAHNDQLSTSHLHDLLDSTHPVVPRYEVMTAVVEALMHDASAVDRSQELQRWHRRWTEVRYAQYRAQAEAAELDHQVKDRLFQAEKILAEARTEADQILKEAGDRAALLRKAETQKIINTAMEAGREEVLKSQNNAAGNGEISATFIARDLRALRAYVDRYVVPSHRATEIKKYLDGLEQISGDVSRTFREATRYVLEQTKGLPERQRPAAS